MTYRRKEQRVRVRFEEPHFLAGLEVVTHKLSVAEFAQFGLRLAEVTELQSAGTQAEQLSALSRLVTAVDDVRQLFADKLVEWDMENEDGSPTPTTLAGVQSLSDDEFFGIVNEWLDAVGGVPDELGKDSGPGETNLELSGLMEPLSPSQAS